MLKYILLVLLCLATPALAQKNKSTLINQINTNWPDQSSGQITPAKLRTTVIDIVNSYYDLNGATASVCAANQWVIGLPTLSSLSCAQPAISNIGGLGTGVASALGINVGTAGAFMLYGSAAGGDLSGTYPNPILNTVNSNVGTWGSSTLCAVLTINAKGQIIAASNATCAPSIANITGLGSGIATALAIGVGSAGAPVLFNGAGGTPTSIVLTNATGTASGLTAGTANSVAVGNITGAGTGCITWLTTPSSTNMRGCLTDETGTGSLFFQNGNLGDATGNSVIISGATQSSVLRSGVSGGAPVNSGTTDANGVINLGNQNVVFRFGIYSSGDMWLQPSSSAAFGTNFNTVLNPNGGNVGIAKVPTLGALDVNGNIAATNIVGTTTNNNACAGCVGELLTTTQSTPQSLTNNTALTITSQSLTAGDWEVSGTISYAYAATTVAQTLVASISLTTNTLDATLGRLNSFNFGTAGVVPNGGFTMNTPVTRVSIASTTTVFLVALSAFTTSTATATGIIRARRVR